MDNKRVSLIYLLVQSLPNNEPGLGLIHAFHHHFVHTLRCRNECHS